MLTIPQSLMPMLCRYKSIMPPNSHVDAFEVNGTAKLVAQLEAERSGLAARILSLESNLASALHKVDAVDAALTKFEDGDGGLTDLRNAIDDALLNIRSSCNVD